MVNLGCLSCASILPLPCNKPWMSLICTYSSSARWSKTNISLVPRAVTRKTESAPGNQQASLETGNGEATMVKMSNDDFRKLLSKN